MRPPRVLALAVGCALVAAVGAAVRVRVDAVAGSDTGCAKRPSTAPCATIQAAVDIALKISFNRTRGVLWGESLPVVELVRGPFGTSQCGVRVAGPLRLEGANSSAPSRTTIDCGGRARALNVTASRFELHRMDIVGGRVSSIMSPEASAGLQQHGGAAL